MKKCPCCAEEIPDEAILCRHCQWNLRTELEIKAHDELIVEGAPEVQSGAPENAGETNPKPNILAVLCAAAMLVAVFLPWAAISSEASVSGQTSTYASEGISGIYFGAGILGAVLAIGGGIFAYMGKKISSIAGVVNLIVGLGFAIGWFNHGLSVATSSPYANISASASPTAQFGLSLFVVASGLFIIFSFVSKTSDVLATSFWSRFPMNNR